MTLDRSAVAVEVLISDSRTSALRQTFHQTVGDPGPFGSGARTVSGRQPVSSLCLCVRRRLATERRVDVDGGGGGRRRFGRQVCLTGGWSGDTGRVAGFHDSRCIVQCALNTVGLWRLARVWLKDQTRWVWWLLYPCGMQWPVCWRMECCLSRRHSSLSFGAVSVCSWH